VFIESATKHFVVEQRLPNELCPLTFNALIQFQNGDNGCALMATDRSLHFKLCLCSVSQAAQSFLSNLKYASSLVQSDLARFIVLPANRRSSPHFVTFIPTLDQSRLSLSLSF
jgi:hypothetical protein